MHEPVLLREVLERLALRPGMAVVDATVGGGGHAEALLEATSPDGRLLGIDNDPAALAVAAQRLARYGDRVRLMEGDYASVAGLCRAWGVGPVDAVLADCGLSSLQLDDPSRGFSFRNDGPLDMRMSPRGARTAADIVNGETEEHLADLFYGLGGERASRRVARRIVAHRRDRPFRTTGELAEVVSGALGRRGRIHPATRVFQALRIAVNGELESLERFLAEVGTVLVSGGRLAVISFHSLEDRRVKQALRSGAAQGMWIPVTVKPVVPSRVEQVANPRSRSAKLRVAERTGGSA